MLFPNDLEVDSAITSIRNSYITESYQLEFKNCIANKYQCVHLLLSTLFHLENSRDVLTATNSSKWGDI